MLHFFLKEHMFEKKTFTIVLPKATFCQSFETEML